MPFVFPTPVGVFPTLLSSWKTMLRLPHTRGGVSYDLERMRKCVESSPHPWGCFRLMDAVRCWTVVFPTPVGVFLQGGAGGGFCPGLPHTRGGVSRVLHARQTQNLSSPHPWGCFWHSRAVGDDLRVFPTPVGVFLNLPRHPITVNRLPHTRGGVSSSPSSVVNVTTSSPHPWGCFLFKKSRIIEPWVFPTPVGVFPAPRP